MAALTSITTFTAVTSVAAHAVATGYAVTTCSSGPPITSGCTDTAKPSFPALAPIGDEDVLVGIAINNVNSYVACVLTNTTHTPGASVLRYGSRSTLSPGGTIVALIRGA